MSPAAGIKKLPSRTLSWDESYQHSRGTTQFSCTVLRPCKTPRKSFIDDQSPTYLNGFFLRLVALELVSAGYSCWASTLSQLAGARDLPTFLLQHPLTYAVGKQKKTSGGLAARGFKSQVCNELTHAPMVECPRSWFQDVGWQIVGIERVSWLCSS